MYLCPVCCFGLQEDPYISFEICERCKTAFGIDDAGPEIDTEFDLIERHEILRKNWLAKQLFCMGCDKISYQNALCEFCIEKNLLCNLCLNSLAMDNCYCKDQIKAILAEELNY